MSESFKIQQNVKVGNDLINLRADNSEEFQAIADWVVANAATFVNVAAALNSIPPALAANVVPGSVQVQQDAPAPQNNGGWGAPQGEAPAFAQPAPQQQPQYSQPAQGGRTCQHGPMVFREGNGAKGPWKGFFCPTAKGTPGQCQPQFIRG